MSVRIVRTRSGEDVICDLYEVTTQEEPEKAVGFQMKSPYSVWISAPQKSEVTSTEEEVIAKITEPSIHFEPWAPLAKDKNLMMKLDEIITVYEAHDEITNKYNQLVEVESGRGDDPAADQTDPAEEQG